MFQDCGEFEEEPPPILDFTCPCEKVKKKKRDVPHIQNEINIAKAVLQESSSLTGENMFDHLSDIIKRILDEKPPNVIDYFEEYSRNIREQKYHVGDPYMNSLPEEPKFLSQALNLMRLLAPKHPPGEDYEDECEVEMAGEALGPPRVDIRLIAVHENVMLMQYYWFLCGFGFHMDEIFLLSCSLKKLQQTPEVVECRFWGKIFGLQKSYYVAEVILTDPMIEGRARMVNYENQNKLKEYVETMLAPQPTVLLDAFTPGISWRDKLGEEDVKFRTYVQPSMPLPKLIPVFEMPTEVPGTGTNTLTYFVCTNLCENWIELPYVTPKQIVTSRQIKKFFTGNLEADLASFPRFSGKEKHYLRAMITRITASGFASPDGYFVKQKRKKTGEGEEEEEEEEEEEGGEEMDDSRPDDDMILVKNKKYKPLPPKDLMEVSNWVHVRRGILKQGRSFWFNEEKAIKAAVKAATKTEGEEGEEEEEEMGEEMEEEGDKNRETTQRLLTNCADDMSTERIQVWAVRSSATYNVSNQVAILRSNLWPGCYNFSMGDYMDHLYVGWGIKFVARNYSPPHILPIQYEYPLGADITETFDPTVQEEEDARRKDDAVQGEEMLDEEGDLADEDENEEEEEEE